MKSERTKNSILNIVANVGTILIQTILIFAVRIIFTKTLNSEYLGIQGLFTNIISMLSLADLGIGTAISFSLYKPLADNNEEKVSQIVTLLKKIYIVIGLMILIIGIIMLPFLKYLTTDYNMGNLELIFVIYLLTLAFEYFFAYPEILITADQKKYKIASINLLYLISVNLMEILILLFTHNFILYILIDLILKTIKFIITNKYIKNKYPKIDFKCNKDLSLNEKNELKLNVKSLFIFKIGDYLVNGTDNILISKFINVSTTGIYGNYLSIICIFKNIINNFINGITSSFGNLIVKENEKTQENVFNIINFFTFICANYIFICLVFLLNPFIKICFGIEYLIDFKCVLFICINFYLATILLPVESVKSAAGLYYKDRYVSIIQAMVNLFFSIVLVKKLGLLGILIGTTISYVVVTVWERPFMVYKYIFKNSVMKYYANYILNGLYVLILYIVFNSLFSLISLPTNILGFIITGIVITIIYLLATIILFHNKEEYKYILKLIKSRMCKNETSSN